jgi:hypothetical protein
MQPHRNGIGEIGLADDDGDLAATHGVAEHDKAGGRARVERHRGFARHDERADGIIGKASHRISFNPDNALLTRDGAGNHIGCQHRRQALRYLDKLNGSGGGRARRPGRRHAVVCRVGHEGEDRIGVVTCRERQRRRR